MIGDKSFVTKFDTQEIQNSLEESYFPKDISIETTAYCNLKCILCPHSSLKREKGNMSMDIFKKIIDETMFVSPKTGIWLAIMGEPLMQSNSLVHMIKYAKYKGIESVNLNTNAMLLNTQISKDLVASGLNKIFISIDGFKSATYESIRIGGNYNILINNIDDFLTINNNKMEIFVQFVVMKENETEMDDFKGFWIEKGVTVKIRPKLGWGSSIDAPNQTLIQNDRTYPCPWLIRQLSVHWNGKCSQCDSDYEGVYSPGDINTQSITEIWNGELKRRRAKHWNNDYSHPLCRECGDWQVARSLFFRGSKC